MSLDWGFGFEDDPVSSTESEDEDEDKDEDKPEDISSQSDEEFDD